MSNHVRAVAVVVAAICVGLLALTALVRMAQDMLMP